MSRKPFEIYATNNWGFLVLTCPPKTGLADMLESSQQWEAHYEGQPVFVGADPQNSGASRTRRTDDRHHLSRTRYHGDHFLPLAQEVCGDDGIRSAAAA